ncbi:MAG: hypothetical protein VB017_05960 [Endomicrobiaceae bacterium]|nr:hypothetical protein [Endomicrobiaceae bacterium]
MKKKILVALLIFNVLPIFVVAQTSISTDTVKANTLQEIEILRNEIASLKDNIKSIDEKPLKNEEIKALLEKDKKEEKNSPLSLITLIVSLYVGIFIFLSIPAGNIQNIPPVMGKLLSRKLNVIVFFCLLGIAISFITSDIKVFYSISINLVIMMMCVRSAINSLNVNNLIQKLFISNSKAFRDSIEFYVNKEDFARAYNLLNSITLDDVNNKKLFNKIKIKLNLKKDCSETIAKSISEIQSLFKNENLVYKKIICRDFFRSYMDLLFKTQDFEFIKKQVDSFVAIFAIFMKQKGEYYQKLYENCSENFVFIIEKAIKDISVSKEEKFIDSLIDRFITYANVMIEYNKTDSLRYMFEEMIKVVRSKEFTEDRFLVLKPKFLKMLKCRSEEVNDILMFFLHRVIRNRMGKKVSSVLIDELVDRQYKFVFEQCNDRKHWNTYLNEYRGIDNQKEVKEILNNKYSLK